MGGDPKPLTRPGLWHEERKHKRTGRNKELPELRIHGGGRKRSHLKRKLKIDRKNTMSRSSKHLKIRSKISQEMLQEEIKVKDGIRGVWGGKY